MRVAERLAARGWSIEWFSARYPGALPREKRHGITFVRSGGRTTVHAHAIRRYRKTRAFDVTVDEINTIPFYAMSYGPPSVALMFQLAREVWLHEAPPVLAQLGYVSERLYLRPYRDSRIITISKSSAETFRAFGLRGEISVVPIAVDELPDSEVPLKNPRKDIVVIGRVAPSKRIEHALEAASILAQNGWNGTLHVAGAGDPDYIARLERRARSLPSCRVVFHGWVSGERRTELLRDASVLWMTSSREGWGLVVTEAARHGTPSVVYNVPGLRDAVTHCETGLLVEETPRALSEATEEVFADFDRYSKSALAASRKYSWDRTTEDFEKILIDAIAQ